MGVWVGGNGLVLRNMYNGRLCWAVDGFCAQQSPPTLDLNLLLMLMLILLLLLLMLTFCLPLQL
jgi:hypothetical protein